MIPGALFTLPSRPRFHGREGHSKELDKIDLCRQVPTFCLAPHPTRAHGVQVSQFGDILLIKVLS